MTLLAILLLATGCSNDLVIATPAPVTVTKEVTVTVEKPTEVVIEVVREVPVTVTASPPPLRQFRNGDEIYRYLQNRPVLMPATGQDCDDLARLFMRQAREDGYEVSCQYLSDKLHMLVMAMTDDNCIYYIEPSTNQYWWVCPID